MEDIRQARTDVAAAIAAGQALQVGRVTFAKDGGRPFTLLPGGTLQSLEAYLPAPSFRRGDVEFYDAESFGLYVNRFKDATSLLFADKVARRFTAVLDYHEEGPTGAPRWGRNRAALPLRHTRSWQTWAAANKQSTNQTAFAQFLEDNIPDVAAPAGAEIVEVARTLEARKAVTFESAIRAQNGAYKFAYHEDIQGTARAGSLSIPEEFTLGLQPFEGSPIYRVMARFRYRIGEGGKLSLWFDLVRLDDVLDAAFSDTRAAIAKLVPDLPMLAGPAPKMSIAD